MTYDSGLLYVLLATFQRSSSALVVRELNSSELVRDETYIAAEQVKDETGIAAEQVKDETCIAAEQVKDETCIATGPIRKSLSSGCPNGNCVQ